MPDAVRRLRWDVPLAERRGDCQGAIKGASFLGLTRQSHWPAKRLTNWLYLGDLYLGDMEDFRGYLLAAVAVAYCWQMRNHDRVDRLKKSDDEEADMSGLRLTAVDAGPLHPDKNKLVAFAASGVVAVPTTVGIIEHPRHGLILWDTGINDAVADPERGDAYWGPGIRDAFGAHSFKREHAIDAQLKRLGFRPEDVRYVIYSHLHLDHAGGMSYFPQATHVMQREEIRYALWPDPWTKPVYCQNDFQDIRKLDVVELEGDCDFFDDGSMRLLKTPGHSPGHQALILNLPQRGKICLGADVGHQKDGFEAMVPMPWDWSTSAMSLTRMRMKQMVRSGVPLYLCHEGKDFAELPTNGSFWD